MPKDIFSLANSLQGRSSPIVTALLYDYCPLAGYWYVRHAPLEEIFDVTWQALEDYASGRTMAECLKDYGLSPLIPPAREYIDKVTAFRRHHTHDMPAPETTLFFKSGIRSLSRFGMHNELEQLGGSWGHFLEYVRVWAFLMRDWKTGMKLPMGENTTRTFRKFMVSLAAPGVSTRTPVHLPAWGWEVTSGRARSVYLGLLVSHRLQDALRFHLVNNSDLAGDAPWPGGRRPHLFALDRLSGEVDAMDPRVAESHALDSVMPIYRLARIGPIVSPAAFREYQRCQSCGYRRICYPGRGHALAEAVGRQVLKEDPRERLHLTRSAGIEPEQE